MSATQIVELNHRHMAIAEYLINHPSARLNEVAQAVGMTPSWVSIVTNSELFRDYFMRRHREVSNMVHIPLHDKLHGVAHVAVEKLGRAVDESTDPNFILAAADKALKNLGFGAPKGPSVQINNVSNVSATSNHVSASIVEEARAKILQMAQGGNTRAPALPPTEGVQTREGGYLGYSAPRPAVVYQEEKSTGPEGARREVREEGLGTPGRDLQPSAAPESLD